MAYPFITTDTVKLTNRERRIVKRIARRSTSAVIVYFETDDLNCPQVVVAAPMGTTEAGTRQVFYLEKGIKNDTPVRKCEVHKIRVVKRVRKPT
jgi:hypothetical protein